MKNITQKKKLSIFTVAGIVAIAALASGFMLDNQIQSQTTENKVVSAAPYVEDATPLHLQEHRSGIAVMSSIEIENPNLNVLTFQKLIPGQFDFIERSINNGATYVSDSELKVYSEQIKEPNHRFMVEDGKSVKYYRISITTPPLSYENHYIKVLEFSEERNISFKPLDTLSKTSITEQLDKPYRWIQVDEQTANSLKSNIDKDGTFFSSVNVRGPAEFQIQYLGPLGEEFKNPEFAKILTDIQERKVMEDHHE